MRTKDDWLRLNKLRAAVARGEEEEVDALYGALRGCEDWGIRAKAMLQHALSSHRRGSPPAAASTLLTVAREIDELRASHDERGIAVGRTTEAGERLELVPEVRTRLELQLELARAWQQVSRPTNARVAYADLLHDIDGETHIPEARHIVAIAEYRSAELCVDDAPGEACNRWRRVLSLRDEEVSPHAALRLALQIGSPHLVSERVEHLFHDAIEANDPRLRSEATLGLARHLKKCHQFGEARKYLEKVVENEGSSSLGVEADRELSSLPRYETMIATRKALTRPQQLWAQVRRGGAPSESTIRVIIVGAGTGGTYLLASLDQSRYTVRGFVDDYAFDVPGTDHPILGRIDDLVKIISQHRPDEVLLAIPTLAGFRRRRVVVACRDTSTPLRNLPGMHELGIGWTRSESRSSLMSQLRRVKVAETLGDRRLVVDRLAFRWLKHKVVVVVGAGALGAELCRRLADGDVGRIIVVDRRESALRKIESDLGNSRDFWAVGCRLGDAGDPDFLADAFSTCAPEVVFNATGDATAAVFQPRRLESDPTGWKMLLAEEVRVTFAAVHAAAEREVPRFIHLSSRSAGAPNDPFGAVKALCEEIMLWHAGHRSLPNHAVVRIGPLLDSLHGHFSRMEEQIRSGSTVTIPPKGTRPRFIPTARWAELALHAARLSGHGDVFEPDGGVEVAPQEVAEEAIRLHDLYPHDVTVEESVDCRWDEPRPLGERHVVGEKELGMFALARPSASDETLHQAIDHCAELVRKHVGDEEAGGTVRQIVAERSGIQPLVRS